MTKRYSYTTVLLYVIYFSYVNVAFCNIFSQQKVFKYNKSLNDEVHLLSKNDTKMLDAFIDEYEEKNDVSVMIVIKDSLYNKSVLEFSEEIFNESKLAQDNSERWVLIVLAVADSEIKISVGRGISYMPPEKEFYKIINKNILPLFRGGKFYEGIRNGLVSIEHFIEPSNE